jgi:hypothetical protein
VDKRQTGSEKHAGRKNTPHISMKGETDILKRYQVQGAVVCSSFAEKKEEDQ